MLIIFFPDYSQGNPYQLLLANALKEMGVQVRIDSPNNKWPICDLLKKHGKFDVLHLHWAHPYLLAGNKFKTFLKSFFFILQLLILKIMNIKVVWTIHNIISHESPNKEMELFFNKLIAKISDEIIILSESAKKVIKKIYNIKKDNIFVIPHGHYINSYTNIISKEEARYSLKIPLDSYVYLYFGAIRPYKGIESLIEAYSFVKKENNILLIAGRPLNKEIKAQIEKLCINKGIRFFSEFISDNKVQLFMNAADVVVLPYKKHLSTSAVILAMSFAKVIIGPKHGEVAELLSLDGGILYNKSETNGLKNALIESRTVNIEKMGKRNIDYIKQFSWDKIALRTSDVYKEAISHKKASSKKPKGRVSRA